MKYWTLQKRLYYIPFWTKHSTEDLEDPEIQLSIQVAGIITALAYTQYLLTISTIVSLYTRMSQPLPIELVILSSLWAKLLFPFFIATLTFVATIQYHPRFPTLSITTYYSRLMFVSAYNERTTIESVDSPYAVFLDVLLGFFVGNLFGVIIAFPFYFLLLLLIGFAYFFFAVFLTSSFAFFFAFILAWVGSIMFLLAIIIKEPAEKTPIMLGELTYPTTQRVLEIIESSEEPIVCPECGSFNASTVVTCRLCGAELIQSTNQS